MQVVISRSVFATFVLLGLALPSVARAEDKSVVASARELGKQGLLDYDAGRYGDAIIKLAKAFQVVRVPTLALHQARALVKVGKWVAAAELYLEATRIPREKNWQAAQDEAVRDAEKERRELLPRIPRLKLLVEGVDADAVSLFIDAASVPSALVGVEQLVDPGERRLEGRCGEQIATQIVQAKERALAEVTLKFAASVSSSKGTAATAPSVKNKEPEPRPPTTAVERSSHGSSQQLLGWIGVGLGGTGLAVGTVAGLMTLSKRSSLSDTKLCTPDLRHFRIR